MNIDNNISINTFIMLTWTNRKVYTRKICQKYMMDISQYIQGSLPLYGRCKTRLCNYAKNNNLDVFEAFSYYNALKSQRDIRKAQFNKTNAGQVRKEFSDIVNTMDPNHSSLNLTLICRFFKRIESPFIYVYKNIVRTPEYRRLPQECLEYIEQLKELVAEIEKSIRERADLFEDQIADFLKCQGFSFKTEKEIRANQTYTVTPDIVFDTPIQIVVDDQIHTIYWLDAKNYTLTNIAHLYRNAKKQATRYNNIFGRGAMIYRYGFDESVRIPGTLILDGSFIFQQPDQDLDETDNQCQNN